MAQKAVDEIRRKRKVALRKVKVRGKGFWHRVKHLFDLNYHYAVMRRDRKDGFSLRGFLRKVFSVSIVSVNRFLNDDGLRSAASLTYYSVLSVAPVLALIYTVARGLGAYRDLDVVIRNFFHDNSLLIDPIVDFVDQAIESAKGGVLTGIGIVLLLWTVFRMLNNVEITMNRIWRIRKGRNLQRKFTEYFAVIILAPVVLIVGSTVNVYLTTSLSNYFPLVSGLVLQLLKLLPYVLVWLLFIFLFMFTPAGRVKFRYALAAALISGTIFQLVQWFYIRFQMGVSSYNAIYGSLALLPLLLVWLQLSWSIVLWGAELCYIFQNRHFMYKSELYVDESWMTKMEGAIRIVKNVVAGYLKQPGGVNLQLIAENLHMNAGKVQQLLDELTDRKILVERREGAEMVYYPAIDFHDTTIADIIINLSRVEESQDPEWRRRFKRAIRAEFTDIINS